MNSKTSHVRYYVCNVTTNATPWISALRDDCVQKNKGLFQYVIIMVGICKNNLENICMCFLLFQWCPIQILAFAPWSATSIRLLDLIPYSIAIGVFNVLASFTGMPGQNAHSFDQVWAEDLCFKRIDGDLFCLLSAQHVTPKPSSDYLFLIVPPTFFAPRHQLILSLSRQQEVLCNFPFLSRWIR